VLVLQDGKKVAYFTATWCGPCKMIAPIFTEISEDHEDIGFMKVDVDACQDVAGSLKPPLSVSQSQYFPYIVVFDHSFTYFHRVVTIGRSRLLPVQ
jgi:thiol-disulfide isomerase/thioredoxin